MRKSLIFALLLTATFYATRVIAQNYDERLVPTYTLPDLLLMRDGNTVQNTHEWEIQQRPYLMDLLAEHVYGYSPKQKIKASYRLLHKNTEALDGKATMQQVLMRFSTEEKTTEALLLVYVPNNRKGRIPVFVGYNFKGNHTVSHDEEILYSPYFKQFTDPSDSHLIRGQQVSRWSLPLIIESGYAVATMCYNDIYPDHKNGEPESILSLFKDSNGTNRGQAIAAWAWGSSRIADWLEQQPWADPHRLIVIGHSRQGKAALWAGAQDTRFKVVISNNSGCGGAALSRREFGETVAKINQSFPHWFNPNFHKYGTNVNALPVDQHTLLAMMAPRHVYVASAEEDRWADPRGEYLALYHASSVYSLYGLKGIQTPAMPSVQQPVMNHVGYHIRTGKHDVTEYDWKCYIEFCDRAFKKE